MKCSNCGKSISRIHYIDGKPYGSECYKKLMVIKYKELSNTRLEEHIKESIAIMETLKTKKLNKITNTWKLNFVKSVLEQWQELNRISKKQLDIIYKELFNNDDVIQYHLAYAELLEGQEKIYRIKYLVRHLEAMCFNETKKYKNLYEELKEACK